MDLTVCSKCGMEYDSSLPECPYCSGSEQSAKPIVEENLSVPPEPTGSSKHYSGKRVSKKAKPIVRGEAPQQTAEKAKASPGMKALCIVLAVAVLAGAGFALYPLQWFPKFLSASAPAEEQAAAEEAEAAPADMMQYTNEEDQGLSLEEAEPVNCTALSLSTTSVTFDEAEQYYNLLYTLEPKDCTQEVSFTSSDESIAIVNQNGKVVAINGGTATITAVCGSKRATCLVTCDFLYDEEAETTEGGDATLNKEDITFFTSGEQCLLTVKGVESDEKITFASEDSSIAEVSDKGMITARKSGTVNITATVEKTGQVLTCVVRCNLSDDNSTSTEASGPCTISHSDVTMSVMGEYFQLTLKDSSGKVISNPSWQTSNASVCTVDGSGTVTATGNGTTTIYAVYNGETYSCIVRCNIQ